MSVNNSARSGGKIGISFRFFNMKAYCVFLLESPHRGDSNEYIQYTIFYMKKKKILNLQLWDLFQGTQERVRNSRGKRAISVRAIEVLLYIYFFMILYMYIAQQQGQITSADKISKLI